MLHIKMLQTVNYLLRNINLRTVCCSYNRQASFLNKLLEKEKKKMRKFKSSGKLTEEFVTQNDNEGNISKRSNILNKVFLDHVTNIMSTGRNSIKLSDLGVNLVKVKLNRNLSLLKVYWVKEYGNAKDQEIQSILDSTAGEIYSQLHILRVVGKPPTVRFVKDLSLQNSMDVYKLCQTADFGPDHCPDDCLLSKNLQDVTEETLPEMRQDVFGLDHLKITTRILGAKIKKKTVTERTIKPPRSEVNPPQTLLPFSRRSFLTYLKKRRKVLKRLCNLDRKPLSQNANANIHELGQVEYEDEYNNYDYEYENLEDEYNCYSNDKNEYEGENKVEHDEHEKNEKH